MSDMPTTATPIAQTPSAPATPAPAAPTEFQLPISTSEAATVALWIKDDLANGKLTPAQADKAFTDLSTPMEQRGPDLRSENQRELDAHFPPARPQDYVIRYDHLNPDDPIPADVKQFDSAARGWLSESGLSREVGNSLVHAIDRVGHDTAQMTAAELDAYGESEYTKLVRCYGDTLGEKLRQANAMIQALEKTRPGLNRLLAGPIGDNALIASLLIQQAAVYHARKR